MNNKKDFTISRMFCCNCGNEGVNIPRKSSQNRKSGHLKKIYCIHCKKIWNHVEIRSIWSEYNYDDFYTEMRYNNFDENGNRKEPYKIFKHKLKKDGIII